MNKFPPSESSDASRAQPSDLLRESIRIIVDTLDPLMVYVYNGHLFVVMSSSAFPAFPRHRAGLRKLREIRIPHEMTIWTRREFDHRIALAASIQAVVAYEGKLLYRRPLCVRR